MARPTIERCRFDRCGIRCIERIGVKMSSSTINKITGTVRCPMSDASPRPTMNPTTASSSIHRPLLTMSESDGYRKWVL